MLDEVHIRLSVEAHLSSQVQATLTPPNNQSPKDSPYPESRSADTAPPTIPTTFLERDTSTLLSDPIQNHELPEMLLSCYTHGHFSQIKGAQTLRRLYAGSVLDTQLHPLSASATTSPN
jgi:hypothetical protein